MRRVLYAVILAVLAMTGTAAAETIDGKFGITGKLGAVVPFEDSEINGTTFSLDDVGFAGGGGLIYGFSNHVAGEVDVIHVPSLDVKMGGGGNIDEAQFTDVSVGVHYRFLPEGRVVPYLGLGVDFIKGDIGDAELDWAVGGHVNAGIDFFLYRRMALSLDCRGIFAEKNDIKIDGHTVGKFNPNSVVATLGVRLFLPEKWW